jgi:beta-phosphoglucomutase-like phosphatase (HAD superfamily)
MACGVTSYLDEDQVDILLEYAGLAELLPRDVRVSLTNGYNRDSQQILGVALRIERRPDHCVLFDSSPGASAAAHEVDMRSVAIIGSYPRYELLTADTTASSFEELTAMNIRRLFGERIYDQPMLEMVEKQPQVIRKTKTTFWDDE